MIEDYRENYGDGWIKIFRSVKNHWIWSNNKPMTNFEAWITILLEVNHSDAKVAIGYDIIECNRGDSLNSLDTWSKLFNWHKSKVRRFFKMLERDNMICFKNVSNVCQKTTHITVCNYDTYQSVRHANDTQTTRKRHANDTKQEEKERKEEKELNISFDFFWNLYDKKIAKVKCEPKWQKLTDEERQKVIDTLPDFISSIRDKQFQPNPETYLNQRRWEDEITQTNKINLLK